ncbi:cbbX [Verticillium alfalfae VaMs.102]|uniref:CbbX n=1 Tax=Verticillium alfalfae (strain VaMs.102 / ATCC MYA-4576 / FGSC 10136) TaxID=526221 RepID=C9SVX4_VERA1|nr:cbbX [Verticillium alfalfae VaMs.102]EEY22939.1 cbbX [Verticillium alfalfae VaMs.102]
MKPENIDPARTRRLAKTFKDIVAGHRTVSTATDARLYLEAVRAQPDPSACIETIVASEHGIRGISTSVRTDPSPVFLTAHVVPFLEYLAHPGIRAIHEGSLLRQILLAIVNPPIAWNYLLTLWLDDTLQYGNAEVFAWLSLEIVTLPGQELVSIVESLVAAVEKRSFLHDTNPKVRELGYRIQRALKLNSAVESGPIGEAPGGRHDNDCKFQRYLRLSDKRRRKKLLNDDKKILGHQSFGALCNEKEIIGFAFTVRDVDQLAEKVLGLQFAGKDTLSKALSAFRNPQNLRFVLVNTPVFAYEPVLERLKTIRDMPLEKYLLVLPDDGTSMNDSFTPSPEIAKLLTTLNKSSASIQLSFPKGLKKILLDESQTASLKNALESPLSIIQGPPVSQEKMIRLGGKYTAATEPIRFDSLYRNSKHYLSNHCRDEIRGLQEEAMSLQAEIEQACRSVGRNAISADDVLSYLEFSEQYQPHYDAFLMMECDDGFVTANHQGKAVSRDYLLRRWNTGAQAPEPRSAEKIENLQTLTDQFDDIQRQVDYLFAEAKRNFIKTKRIVGCTTTAASMHSSLISAFAPDVVMVEEAGEILEAHILAALQPCVQQLILIGDHKQLRPKVNNYTLSVEHGGGFDLNRSLFERLILQGHRHTTLCKQHRMHPDISQLVRQMTYPELLDGDKMREHPIIRGLLGRVMFINHDKPELDGAGAYSQTDVDYRASKQNPFEAKLVLKLVKYLGQQGYGNSHLVVLTPYLGQLCLLRDELSKENDPLLNDMDSAELIRAGLMTTAASLVAKTKIRLSTIGEESDIVIASLTRSNARGDIGFMKAPERLNVLVSRARNSLIMIGNLDTFIKSTQGQRVWVPFFNILREKQFLQDGFWVRCEQHPSRIVMLAGPEDFDLKCPDGGCSEPCGTKLKCGLHTCQRRCHRLLDHNIEAERRMLQFEKTSQEQDKTLEQRRADLQALKQTRARQEAIVDTEQKNEAASVANSASSSKPKAGSEIENTGAQKEWEEMKRVDHARCDALDTLMSLIGLEGVKQNFLSIKNRVDTSVRQQISLKVERFSCSLLGNPGTVIAGSEFEETTGSKLASMGVTGCQTLIEKVLENGGGVIFIDEAYQLSSGNSPGGRAVLDFLLAEVENLTGMIVFVLAGYNKQMETFFAHNPGFPSRFPLEMKFEDYDDKELLRILERQISKKFGGRMTVEDGLQGLFCRIVARRLGMGRGTEGFGNARAVENAFSRICMRQADRLLSERRKGLRPDDLKLSKEDLIGPQPTNALQNSKAWGKMQGLVGLSSVKESVQMLLDTIQANYQREMVEEPVIQFSLNRVFLGSPGTGKTTVAKIYGQILVDLGLLSSGEVIVKNPSDFIGAVMGQSEQQTRGILAATVGKVLVIDEAYGLYGGGGTQGRGTTDPYRTAVIDTIVAEVQSTPGDDRCVLLLGYKDQLEEMFQNVNPGLSRRFPLASAFVFEDFDNDDLRKILDLKLKQQGFKATDQAKTVAIEVLDRARNRPNFGNAGEIDILLDQAKGSHQKRLSLGQTEHRVTLGAVDFDAGFERMQRSQTNIPMLFEGTVGCEKIVAILQGYQDIVRTSRLLGMDPKGQVPFNFLFRGPPGTGKTSTAKKMGKVFMDMGLLASADVLDCSATDLIGQYVGQTGPKVQQLLDKALGRVLLIDEAYRLADGQFAKEALDELVDAVTKDKYEGRLVIILAGYENDINRLMSVNPGMTSRFPETIDFYSLDPGSCLELLTRTLQKQKQRLKGTKGDLNFGCLERPSRRFEVDALRLFDGLSKQTSWASARDIETLAKAVFNVGLRGLKEGGGHCILVSEDVVLGQLQKMLHERHSREKRVSHQLTTGLADLSLLSPPIAEPTLMHQHEERTTETSQQGAKEDDLTPPSSPGPNLRFQNDSIRDAGVSNEVWEQLQKDAKAEGDQEEHYQSMLEAKKTADEGELDRIMGELIGAENRRRQEAEARRKLALSGRCPVGYAWIKQAGGYRCAGGSHFVRDLEMA